MRKVPAVARAIGILDFLAVAPGYVPISTIAAALQIPRNSTYELVATLVDAELLVEGAGGVALGPRLLMWGGAYAKSVDLIRAARDVARQLATTVNATVHVARLDGREVVYLVKEEGRQQIRMGSAVGHRVVAHATAVGKVLIAALPTEQFEQYLSGGPWPALTAHTVTDPKLLRVELMEIRDHGVAFEANESSPEVACVAAAVHDEGGEATAAMSIAVLSASMSDGSRISLSRSVLDGARKLSRILGWMPELASPRTFEV